MACSSSPEAEEVKTEAPVEQKNPHMSAPAGELTDLLYPQEKYIKNLRQLTFGGDNAEAYWSFDDSKLVFQRQFKDEGVNCDQIYYAEVGDGGTDFDFKLVSTGKGRTTCSYFLPGDDRVIYASTHLAGDDCPSEPERSHGKYVWPIYQSFELFIADLDGNVLTQLTDNEFYDAEATVSPNGDKIIFTSDRSGDLELYTMNLDGTDLKQITDELGYDGGAFFSPDGSKIVWRASRPKSKEDQRIYKEYFAKHQVSPSEMELFVANADGTDARQVTDLGGANWAPFFHPSGEKILFCSNHKTKSFPFNLFLINLDGTGLEQVTFDGAFDSFPMFSRKGDRLAFSSNRNNGGTRHTNMFVADWVD